MLLLLNAQILKNLDIISTPTSSYLFLDDNRSFFFLGNVPKLDFWADFCDVDIFSDLDQLEDGSVLDLLSVPYWELLGAEIKSLDLKANILVVVLSVTVVDHI